MVPIGAARKRSSVVLRSTILPLLTPDELRGRVTAVEMVFISASNELGAFESGVAARLFDCLGREVAGIESNGDVCHCHGPLLPGTRDQVRHLVPGLPSAGE